MTRVLIAADLGDTVREMEDVITAIGILLGALIPLAFWYRLWKNGARPKRKPRHVDLDQHGSEEPDP